MATEMTMRKLIMYVVLIVVLIVVIIGFTGAFNPLIDRVVGKFDEVLIFLNLKEGANVADDCFKDTVLSLPKGKEFLDKLGVTNKDSVVFSVCNTGECKIDFDSESYRIEEGRFEFLGDDGKWYDTSGFFIPHNNQEDLDKIKLYWDLYNGVIDVLFEKGVSDFYKDRIGKRFSLYGKGLGDSDNEIAVWEYGIWEVRVGDNIVYSGDDDNYAIDLFFYYVNKGYNDDVSYLVDDPTDVYITSSNFHGKSTISLLDLEYDKFDEETQTKRVKEEFYRVKQESLSETRFNKEDVLKLSDVLDDEKVVANGVDFNIKVEWNGVNNPYISLMGDGLYYLKFGYNSINGLEYNMKDEDSQSYSLINAGLSKYPLVLTDDMGNKVVYYYYYKLPKNIFDKSYRASVIRDFIRERCNAM